MRSRLAPSRALIGAIVLLAAGTLASVYQDRIFRAQRARELTVQGEILAASVTAALVFGDAKTVQEHVSALAINPEIGAVAVYGNARNLVGSFARKNAEPLPAFLRDRNVLDQSSKVMIDVPVTHQDEQLGFVIIRAIDEPWARRLTRHVPMMLLAVMAALLLAFMATSQRALSDANRQLESRAVTLSETNRLLQTEMQERGKAEEALRQSQKMEAVGRLAGGIAHDFNNLLTIIQGSLHLLRSTDAGNNGEAQQLVASADAAADRAGHLVRRLLGFSRRQPLSPRPVDLNALLTGMKDLITHSVGDRVRVDWELQATWQTQCDVNQMENVILNLAINARDSMPDGGTLTIATQDCSFSDGADDRDVAPGDYVELRMRDTGFGMTEDVRRRAIDPFFTTKPQGQGTGLGLSTAFAFIRQSNGSLVIESVPDAGTTIVVLLPRLVGSVA